ncbi:MAG TPA: ferredoxin [Methanofastidiosum sp.]|jgi:ferredoxin|nr:ferredoxin [Methanofastidiosum sp.]
MMKVHIKQEECILCGNCSATCPEVFILEPGESSKITKEYRGKNDSEGEVGEDMLECVQSAVDSCPVNIISIEKLLLE